MTEFTIYAIGNECGEIYIGYTGDIEQRLKRHNGILKNKATSFTRRHKTGKWRLIYSERCDTRARAMAREKQLKSYQGRRFIREIISAGR